MVLSILGVYGVPSTDDTWLLEDMTLLHDTLPATLDAVWLSSISLEEFGTAVQMHGNPRAERVILPSSAEGFSWLTTVPARKLKSRFLKELEKMTESTKSKDMLIVCINTHGSNSPGEEGAIQLGHRWIKDKTWVQC